MIGAFILLFIPGAISARIHNKQEKSYNTLSYGTLWAVYSFIIDWLLCLVKMVRGNVDQSVQECFSSVGTVVKYGVLAGGLAIILPFIWLRVIKILKTYYDAKINGQSSLKKQNYKEQKHANTFSKPVLLSILFLIPVIILVVIICANY